MPVIDELEYEDAEPLSFSGAEEQIAISLFDLNRLPLDIRAKLMKDKIDAVSDHLITIKKDTAVMFTCSLKDASLICDYIRQQDREAGDRATLVFLNRGGGWGKVPQDMDLTIVENGDPILNPRLFPRKSEIKPLPVKRV